MENNVKQEDVKGIPEAVVGGNIGHPGNTVGQGSVEDALAPSAVVRDRLMEVIELNNAMNDACHHVLDILAEHPEADEAFARVFGIRKKVTT